MMKVLIVESEFLHQDTWVGNAVERLADALSQQNVTVIKSTSFDDGFAILSSIINREEEVRLLRSVFH